MSDQDIFLVAGMATLAVLVTLVDLLLSFFRHRRKVAAAKAGTAAGPTSDDEVAEAKREAIRYRLAVIQSAMGGHEEPTRPRTKPD